MDTIKHEFMGYVRPYYDRPDILVPVQWYIAPPEADFYPGVTAFANVVGFDRKFVPNVGMQHSFSPNSVGNVDGNLGIKACGTPDAFRFGVSYNNPPPPCDCQREPVVPVKEIPAGTVDGTNRNFTTSQLPMSNMSFMLFVGGVALTEGVDYSLSGQNIYMAAAATPQSGDNIYCTYWVIT